MGGDVLNSRLTILIDAREKRPLPIPAYLPIWDYNSPRHKPTATTLAITTRTATLPAGDYALEGWEGTCLIERKAHLTELYENLVTADRTRFHAALARLASTTARPVLFLEGDPLTLGAPLRMHGKLPPPPPFIIRDLLLHTLREYNVELMFLPTSSASARRAAGEWVTAKLIAESLHGNHRRETPPPPAGPHDPQRGGGLDPGRPLA